jgi:hypothetical protein
MAMRIIDSLLIAVAALILWVLVMQTGEVSCTRDDVQRAYKSGYEQGRQDQAIMAGWPARKR